MHFSCLFIPSRNTTPPEISDVIIVLYILNDRHVCDFFAEISLKD